MPVANRLVMPIVYPEIKLAAYIVEKTGEKVIEQLNRIDRRKVMKKINQTGAKVRAKRLGIVSKKNIEIKIKTNLAARIQQEVRSQKLRHVDVASISLLPRTKVTAIMNNRLRSVSIDLLVRLLGCLGISSRIVF
jgi:predicted XRE-type DNA-binding protein